MPPFIANQFRQALISFLTIGGCLAFALFLLMLVRRAVDELRLRHRARIIDRFRPQIDALLRPNPPAGALARLARCPQRHRIVVGSLLLAPLRVATGGIVEQMRRAAAALQLVDKWKRQTSDRRWWVRAEAVRALGLVRESSAADLLLAALDDDHEEVRAAAVEALGVLRDPKTIPSLLLRLPEQSRHQRARIVEALREFGEPATQALLEHARCHRVDAVVVADLLNLIRGTGAVDELVAWSADQWPELRASALRALGSIGLDERAYYYALRALHDDHAEVRAMAARALGRSRRQETAPYLAGRLDDEWFVAAEAAVALRELGQPGLEELELRAGEASQAGQLARQMVWERQTVGAGA